MSKIAQEVLEVVRPAVGDGRGADGVLEDEVPADDPGEELAEGGVARRCRPSRRPGPSRRTRRSRARRRCRRSRRRRTRASAPGPVRSCAATPGQHEDAGADDRADPEAGELDRPEHSSQPVVALGLLEEDLEALLAEQTHVSPFTGGILLGLSKIAARSIVNAV